MKAIVPCILVAAIVTLGLADVAPTARAEEVACAWVKHRDEKPQPVSVFSPVRTLNNPSSAIGELFQGGAMSVGLPSAGVDEEDGFTVWTGNEEGIAFYDYQGDESSANLYVYEVTSLHECTEKYVTAAKKNVECILGWLDGDPPGPDPQAAIIPKVPTACELLAGRGYTQDLTCAGMGIGVSGTPVHWKLVVTTNYAEPPATFEYPTVFGEPMRTQVFVGATPSTSCHSDTCSNVHLYADDQLVETIGTHMTTCQPN